jgi:hypothetical protein
VSVRPRTTTSRTLAGAALLSCGLALAACTPADGEAAGSSSGSSAAVDTDAVQTDAPVTDSAVVVTSAEYAAGTHTIDAFAFVQGLVEDGGSCVLEATQDGVDPVTGPDSAASAGPSTTDCGALTVTLPEGSTGTWEVSVSYTSPRSDLSSAPTEVELP